VTGEHGGPGCPGVGGGQRRRCGGCSDGRWRDVVAVAATEAAAGPPGAPSETAAGIPPTGGEQRNGHNGHHPPSSQPPGGGPRTTHTAQAIRPSEGWHHRSGGSVRGPGGRADPRSDARDPVPGWPAIRCRAVGPDCSEEFVATDALKAAVGCVAVPGARGLNPGRTHHAVVATRTDRVERHDSGANRGQDPTRHTVGRTAAALLPLGGVPSEVTSSRKVR
jgi:hypothetical protein